MRKATLNASVISDAPKARAIRISRTRPVMRDSIVRLLIVASALSRFKVWIGAGRWIGAGACRRAACAGRGTQDAYQTWATR
ncbi:hypothetical protein Tamer19_11050 [Cupriavidus sp. TA19]|nr:hypothetical protein Tamer19_11050 [Cupriavidus sp. TA19]